MNANPQLLDQWVAVQNDMRDTALLMIHAFQTTEVNNVAPTFNLRKTGTKAHKVEQIQSELINARSLKLLEYINSIMVAAQPSAKISAFFFRPSHFDIPMFVPCDIGCAPVVPAHLDVICKPLAIDDVSRSMLVCYGVQPRRDVQSTGFSLRFDLHPDIHRRIMQRDDSIAVIRLYDYKGSPLKCVSITNNPVPYPLGTSISSIMYPQVMTLADSGRTPERIIAKDYNYVEIKKLLKPGHNYLQCHMYPLHHYINDASKITDFSALSSSPCIVSITILAPMNLQDLVGRAVRVSMEDAVERVKKSFVHDDDDVSVGVRHLSLMCPLSLIRLQYPARTRTCQHFDCFDFVTYVQLNMRTGRWKCPICKTLAMADDLIIDPFIEKICKEAPEQLEKVTLKPDATWSSEVDTPAPNRKRKTPGPDSIVDLSLHVDKKSDTDDYDGDPELRLTIPVVDSTISLDWATGSGGMPMPMPVPSPYGPIHVSPSIAPEEVQNRPFILQTPLPPVIRPVPSTSSMQANSRIAGNRFPSAPSRLNMMSYNVPVTGGTEDEPIVID